MTPTSFVPPLFLAPAFTTSYGPIRYLQKDSAAARTHSVAINHLSLGGSAPVGAACIRMRDGSPPRVALSPLPDPSIRLSPRPLPPSTFDSQSFQRDTLLLSPDRDECQALGMSLFIKNP